MRIEFILPAELQVEPLGQCDHLLALVQVPIKVTQSQIKSGKLRIWTKIFHCLLSKKVFKSLSPAAVALSHNLKKEHLENLESYQVRNKKS